MDAQINHIHPPTLEERPPEFISSWFYWGRTFIEQNGWILLGAGVLVCYLWVKIQPYIKKWRKQQDERRYAAFCHKNPDLVRSRQEAMDISRQRLQEQHDENAKVYAEKLKEHEAKKKKEYLERQERKRPVEVGHRLSEQTSSSQSNSKGQKSAKSSHRPDYNPLMGAGGSGGYRPPRRTCPGGGCGGG